MWYVFDEHRNLADKDGAIVTGIYNQGETYTFDGIEVYCLLGTGEADHPLFVDKNHDLSYYFAGSDFLNTSEGSSIISNAAKYGYEWGGYGTKTGITSTDIGTGLANTNSLIAMNLQPSTSGWNVLWNKVQDFRTSYGHNWFVPSKDELNLVYQQKASLTNITDSDAKGYNYYWSSSERSSYVAWSQYFNPGGQYTDDKNYHSGRARLCYTI